MSKQFLGILAAVVVGLGLIFLVSGNNKNKPSDTSSAKAQASHHVQGQGKTGITLMEYGDYQCPVCGIYYPVVKDVAAKYDKEIYFQFRNLPLVQIHPNAFAAARAAEAAGKQNKYFEMHDLLYEQQQLWSSLPNPQSTFQTYAQQLNLDINKFNSDYSSSAVNDVIQADISEFNKTGQQMATPAFFIDGKFIPLSELADDNGPNFEKFTKVIDAAIAAKQ